MKKELIEQTRALAAALQKECSTNAAALKAFRKVNTAAEILESEWDKSVIPAQTPDPKPKTKA